MGFVCALRRLSLSRDDPALDRPPELWGLRISFFLFFFGFVLGSWALVGTEDWDEDCEDDCEDEGPCCVEGREDEGPLLSSSLGGYPGVKTGASGLFVGSFLGGGALGGLYTRRVRLSP